jgi:hypothetical protein
MNQRLVAGVCGASFLVISSAPAADDNPFGASGTAAQTVQLKTISPVVDFRSAEEKILEALSQKTDLDFEQTPASLKDVVDVIKAKHGIEVVLDGEPMKQAGIDPAATLISKSFKDISLRSALRLILRDFNMTYIIDNEVLLITTKDSADSSLKARVYDVRDLVGVKNGAPDGEALGEIAQLITSTVEPASWKADGGSGQGSLRSFTKNGVCVLVAYQTFDAHEKIVALLDELRAHRDAQKGKE